ncbi:hypothetical protein HC752_02595 [Vibrio sp. S9_S30]|uniref:hypothetical protein n=1 Tax=Vibrio sp. S9_S30 TaxID=2720226 RepID=UPI00167FEED8|nr:hypothetical protein [Vibrio sp. S9_S30]MBD1555826.1 hypothetical protein [Vibrio sp. S9_S30]
MKLFAVTGLMALTLVGCSSAPTQQDNYMDASFELCNTEVNVYSVSDDGRVRIVCADGSKFALRSEATLETMRNINADYCSGEGLSKFNESQRYYQFRCKSGETISVNK